MFGVLKESVVQPVLRKVLGRWPPPHSEAL